MKPNSQNGQVSEYSNVLHELIHITPNFANATFFVEILKFL